MNKTYLYSVLTAVGVVAATMTPAYFNAVCNGSSVISIFGG